MNTLELYKDVFGNIELDTQKEIISNLEVMDLAFNLSGAEIDTLNCAFKTGPLEDGDVPSKSGRDELVSKGLMGRVIVNGAWGYNACTYKGAWVQKTRAAISRLLDGETQKS